MEAKAGTMPAGLSSDAEQLLHASGTLEKGGTAHHHVGKLFTGDGLTRDTQLLLLMPYRMPKVSREYLEN